MNDYHEKLQEKKQNERDCEDVKLTELTPVEVRQNIKQIEIHLTWW